MADRENANFAILSGSYCSPEISAEFGKLPPSFIPLGQGRLYDRQLALARACNARPVLSIPSNYVIQPWDAEKLAQEGVRVVRSPTSLTLNEAAQFVLEVIDATGPLYILYGDTLVEGDRLVELDQAAVHRTRSNYHWAEAHVGENGMLHISSGYGDGTQDRSVLCGYFSFSDAMALRRACVTGDNFDASIETYARNKNLRTIEVREWHDFGHLSLIYQSRRNVMVSRSFNSIHSDGVALAKTSSKKAKIRAEAHWYESIPGALRVFTPQYLGHDSGAGSYRLEYLYLPTLAELFTFGELPAYAWNQIMESCLDFLRECRNHQPAKDSEQASPKRAERIFDNLFRRKTQDRVQTFLKSRGWDDTVRVSINGRQHAPISDVCQRLLDYIAPTRPEHITVWHGDFFFGNMLYDFRAGRVRVVDPRGGDTDTDCTIYGDNRYDVAKLAHSIMGGYDSLLVGRVDFEELNPTTFRFDRCTTPAQEGIVEIFASLEVNGAPLWTDEIRAMTALLFLTMLPLHVDDPRRQNIMLCNGLLMADDLFNKSES
ncbi:phosphotransferase [Tropicimonas marinistellae]|uniref:phosphotransferase n=1 Tax=Tropicimonas marinistellae TaxID=1739787 RepID=UPI000831544B|nr:phosphotransferase [Tropicimonas marinistellae]